MVTGGEGDVGDNKEETEPQPLVYLARREMVGGGWSVEKEVRWWRRLVSEGAPVVDRRRGVAGQVHEGEAKLGMGSARAERL